MTDTCGLNENTLRFPIFTGGFLFTIAGRGLCLMSKQKLADNRV